MTISTGPTRVLRSTVMGGAFSLALTGLARGYTLFDVPGASFANTSAINDSGVVTGTYSNSSDNEGYVRLSDGTVTVFNVINSDDWTIPRTINSLGVIAGSWGEGGAGGNCFGSGFVRATDGKIKSFDVPNSGGTESYGIAADGTIAGGWFDSCEQPILEHSFIRSPTGDVTTFDPPGFSQSAAFGINAKGKVVGYGANSGVSYGGYIRNPDGKFDVFYVQGNKGNLFTYAYCMNDKGFVAGAYQDDKENYHAFLRSPDGTITPFDITASNNSLYINGISKENTIVGSVYTNGERHGWYRTADGVIKILDFPKTSLSLLNGISPKGRAVGVLNDKNGSHGLLMNPH